MKRAIAWPLVAIGVLGGVDAALASDLKDEIKIEIASSEVHSGMEPGMYVCAAGHLHIKGTVQNLATVPVGPIKVAGKVFDADGRLLGSATAFIGRTSTSSTAACPTTWACARCWIHSRYWRHCTNAV